MKRSLIIFGLVIAFSSVAYSQQKPIKKKGQVKVAQPTTNLSGGDDPIGKTQRSAKKPTNNISEFDSVFVKPNTKSTQRKTATGQTTSTKKQIGKRGTTNGIEMTPCDVQGKSGTIGDCDKVNEQNTQRSTKSNKSNAKTTGPNAPQNTNFQTTSEDLQSVKAAKTQNGVNDPGDWSSKTKRKTTPKSSNTTLRKRKVNGVYEEDEQKTPKKKP